MKRRGERLEERGEGRLIAAALIVILALSLAVYCAGLPVKRMHAPLHAVPEDIYRAELVDINRASVEEIAFLPGIGDVLAGRIVMYREVCGRFESAEDLLNVDGIGMGKLEGVRWHIYME